MEAEDCERLGDSYADDIGGGPHGRATTEAPAVPSEKQMSFASQSDQNYYVGEPSHSLPAD